MIGEFKTFENEKVAIVHDSAASLPDKYRMNYSGLAEVPFKITSVSRLWVDDPYKTDEEKAEFVRELQTGQVTTSLPSPGDYIETCEKIINKGITEIGIIPMSNHPKMSGSYNSARFAAEELKDKANVAVFDSKTVSVGQGLLIKQADDENKVGRFETADELINRVEDLSKGLYLAQAFSDLGHLRRTGRIGLAANMVGVVGGIIPILNLSEEGELRPVVKKRGWKKAHKAIVEHVAEGVENHDPKGILGNVAVRIAFVHFESEHIDDLRAVAMERVQSDNDDEETSKLKFKLAVDNNGDKYQPVEGVESFVTAAHTGAGVDGFGALVIPDE